MNHPHPPIVESGAENNSRASILFARLLIGLVVLVSAEVLSGASLQIGLWHPWTLLVTYWLYFAHFFLLTTLAVCTGRTSLSALYLWGVLFGLYESWITKVIWWGYDGNGTFALGTIGPYGFSEISMVFLFHPVVSFILPLAMSCLLCPALRQQFPDLAWLTGKAKWARIVQAYLLFSLAPVMAMNSGGPLNLVRNLAVAVVLLLVLTWLARPALHAPDGRRIVVFGRWGLVGLCLYLALLYGVSYVGLRPEGLPSVRVQLLTLVFYALAMIGLWLHRRRDPLSGDAVTVQRRERQLVVTLLVVLCAVALGLSVLGKSPFLYVPIALNFVAWTLLGFLLTGLALARGIRERLTRDDNHP